MKTNVIYPDITPILSNSQVSLPERIVGKSERIFQQAIVSYNKGHVYHAMQTAKYALRQARRSGEYCKSYIYGFLAQIKNDLNQPELAGYYCRQALNSLQSGHQDFAEDRQYYHLLLRTIGTGKII